MKLNLIYFKVNRIIKNLIWADLILESSWGLISPVFAIFVVEKIVGGNAFVAGLSSAIYLIVFALTRIPIAIFLDKKGGEKDDFLIMFLGFFFVSFIPFGFIFSKLPYHLYLLQAGYGVCMAAAFAGYMSLFTKRIDKGKEATEWGIRASLISLAMGTTAAVGGALVATFGFNFVFIMVGIFNFLSAFFVFSLKNEFLKK